MSEPEIPIEPIEIHVEQVEIVKEKPSKVLKTPLKKLETVKAQHKKFREQAKIDAEKAKLYDAIMERKAEKQRLKEESDRIEFEKFKVQQHASSGSASHRQFDRASIANRFK
jgi:uncharacterized protein (DUF3084 family)